MMARRFVFVWLIMALTAATGVLGHSEYTGKCPDLKPMKNFDWDKFSKGRWYAMEKFGTSSKCLTYTFGGIESGDMFVEQRSTLTGLSRLALPNKTIYRGRLVVPAPSDPANMIVRFPLSLLGTASFVVLDTDYDAAALVCTCQSTRIFFDVFTFHRRSCTILQRRPVLDEAISKKFYALLDGQIPSEDDEPAHHDFDVISHANCDYSDSDKGLQIDVDKIIGSTQSEIVDLFDDTLKVLRSKTTTTTEANSNDSEFTTIPPITTTENATSKATVREIEQVELNEISVKDENPKV